MRWSERLKIAFVDAILIVIAMLAERRGSTWMALPLGMPASRRSGFDPRTGHVIF